MIFGRPTKIAILIIVSFLFFSQLGFEPQEKEKSALNLVVKESTEQDSKSESAPSDKALNLLDQAEASNNTQTATSSALSTDANNSKITPLKAPSEEIIGSETPNWPKTVYEFVYKSDSQDLSLGFNEIVENTERNTLIDMSESSPRAISLKSNKGAKYQYSFDGVGYINAEPTTEGLENDKYDVSNLIYVPEGWSGGLYINFEGEIALTVHVIPNEIPAGQMTPQASQTELSSNYWGGATATTLPIIPRSVWGANPQNWDPNSSININSVDRLVWLPEYYRIKGITIHHTATAQHPSDPAQSVRDIYLYHTYSNGWGDIGYNYLIDSFGNIYEGKIGGDGAVSYHAYTEPNHLTMSIALIGNFTNSNPTPAAIDSLARLLAEKSVFNDLPLVFSDGSEAEWFSEAITVYGHRDTYFWCRSDHPEAYRCPGGDQWIVNATACPGAQFHTIIESQVIPLANQYRTNGFGTLKEIVEATDSQFVDQRHFTTGMIYVRNSTIIDPVQFEASLPIFSGINYAYSTSSSGYIYVYDQDGGGDVTNFGWQGFYVDIFPPDINWRNERIKNLIKIFTFNNSWDNVGLNYQYEQN